MSAPHQGVEKPYESFFMDEYQQFLRMHRGLAKATIGIRTSYLCPFFEELKLPKTTDSLKDITANQVHDYVIKTARIKTRSARKHLVSSLRSFLRFAYVRGYTEKNLVDAVPVIRTHALDLIPRGIPWDAVQKLLAAPNRDSHSGRRDYAVLQLMATYGVRIGQITTLKMADIDWQQHTIKFAASKKGRNLCLPLTYDVTEALLAYFRCSRGNANFPEVFLTVRGTPRPLGENNHLYCVIGKYYRWAGIDSKVKGTHAIRHAFATRLMEQDVPIKTIADLLGHKCIQTTAIYTKVDMEHLRTVACEWLEVEQ